MRTEFFYPSVGQGTIRGFRWEPEGEPKAVVQIVHGIAEHIGRYEGFAEYLNSQGILVVAEDHMGHGGSVGEKDTRGYFTGGWFKAVQDTYRLLRNTRMDYPDLPYFLLGHSMGSFMVRTLMAKHPDCGLSGVILSGTGWIHPALINTASAACTLAGKRSGFQRTNSLLQAMVFGGNNNRIEHKRTAYDWLSRDNKVVDAYIADPMCGFPATVGLLRDMMTGLRYIQDPVHLQKMNTSTPVLFISGSEDPVGGYGQGVRQAVNAFRDAGMEDVILKLYPMCRHELLNEINKEEVYGYILSWLGRQGVDHA